MIGKMKKKVTVLINTNIKEGTMEEKRIVFFDEMTCNSVYIGIQRKSIIQDNKKLHDEINFFTYYVEKPDQYINDDDLYNVPGIVLHYRIEDDSDNSLAWVKIIEELGKSVKDYSKYNGFLKIDKSEIVLTNPYITRVGAILSLTHMIGTISNESNLKVINL